MRWLPGVRFETPDPTPAPDEVLGHYSGSFGLYAHIPFCRFLCPFCPYDRVLYEPQLATDYGRALLGEAAAYLAAGMGPVTSLYVGGGTPTLCLDVLEGLTTSLVVTGERAIEVLPTHLTEPLGDRLVALGFDAVSIGVQSFDPDALAHLGRPTTERANRAALEVARGRFRCVDVDLIFDTAFDRPEVLLTDLRTCFEAGVDQVSTYPLMRFGYTPFGKAEHAPAVEHELLAAATALAAEHGYERRAVWSFNRIGGPAYTSITRPRYLGLGASAASVAGEWFHVDHFGVAAYVAAVTAGRLPIARTAQLRPAAAAAYALFWQLYTGAVPVDGAAAAGGGRARLRPLLAAARALGWLTRDDGQLRLTHRGYDRYHDLERWVTYHLIEPLWAELLAEQGPATGLAGAGRLGTAA
jgi:coproporphyrinogen III oxidase-like Fe-S oxidoreductase